jgi:hypothetical protein
MRNVLLAAVALAALSIPAISTSANAEVVYPWCAYYTFRDGDATNCGFVNRQQCLATVSGVGGYCAPNPRYNPPRSRR